MYVLRSGGGDLLCGDALAETGRKQANKLLLWRAQQLVVPTVNPKFPPIDSAIAPTGYATRPAIRNRPISEFRTVKNGSAQVLVPLRCPAGGSTIGLG